MPSPALIYRRLLHAIDNHGAVGVVKRMLQRTARSSEPAAPSIPEIHPFDVAHGTDTSGHVHGEALATGAASDLYNTAYWAISPSTLLQAFANLPPGVLLARYTFVDLGCGKGRALLLAARQGFGAVVGVELAPELADVARRNTAPYPNVEVRTQDAVTVTYPREPLVVFLYHPFLGPLLKRVLQNLIRQHGVDRRETYLLFANPSYDKLISSFPLDLVWSHTYKLAPEDAAADRHGITEERYVLYQLR